MHINVSGNQIGVVAYMRDTFREDLDYVHMLIKLREVTKAARHVRVLWHEDVCVRKELDPFHYAYKHVFTRPDPPENFRGYYQWTIDIAWPKETELNGLYTDVLYFGMFASQPPSPLPDKQLAVDFTAGNPFLLTEQVDSGNSWQKGTR